MDTENRISIIIRPEILEEIKTSIRETAEKLNPYVITLTPEERKSIPKMQDASLPFVQKILDYCVTDTQFAPPYLNVNELRNDVNAAKDLLTVFRPLAQIYSLLSDTIMLCGSEAYVASLTYYNSVKLAAKKNVPGAKIIYDDLKKRFEINKVEKEVEVPGT